MLTTKREKLVSKAIKAGMKSSDPYTVIEERRRSGNIVFHLFSAPGRNSWHYYDSLSEYWDENDLRNVARVCWGLVDLPKVVVKS